MKIPKHQIRLSEMHPSLLLDLAPDPSTFQSPILITKDFELIDGYMRYQLCVHSEMDAVEVPADDVFDAAYRSNLHTRKWDETDCFLWSRWANHLNVSTKKFSLLDFEPRLFEIEESIIRLLAKRSLHFRQFNAIARVPVTYHRFFTDFLTTVIELNPNETSRFIEMALDLKKLQAKSSLKELFETEEFAKIIQNNEQTRKQKGENLLKEMRILRYPYYHKRSELFSSYWQQLNIGRNISLKKSLFLERGLLELTITATSPEEFRERLQRLCESGNSPLWKKIWEDETL